MQFGTYRFVIRLEDDATLPYYKGSTFRGVLGHALRRVVCPLKRQECVRCLLKESCTYALVFETASAVPLPDGSRVSSAPPPMVLQPPASISNNFRKGDTLECTLLLFGRINRNLPYFIYAFEQMGQIGIGRALNGRRSRFVLESVTSGDHGHTFYSRENPVISLNGEVENLTIGENRESPCSRISMEIHTPLRIISRQVPVARLPFSLLMRNMLRRATSLLNVYGEGEPDLDYAAMVAQSEEVSVSANSLKWFDWKRYSSTQERKMFMGGLVGTIEYEGDLSAFLPVMRMVQKVHLGKNTAFGLGKVAFAHDAGD